MTTLNVNDLLPGDHIYVRRSGILYAHHGIYAGGGRVIHFSGRENEKVAPLVHASPLAWFLKGGELRRREYSSRLAPAETLRIALELIDRTDYSLLFNNCEHFATYCATGRRQSLQAKRFFAAACAVCMAAGALITLDNNNEII